MQSPPNHSKKHINNQRHTCIATALRKLKRTAYFIVRYRKCQRYICALYHASTPLSLESDQRTFVSHVCSFAVHSAIIVCLPPEMATDYHMMSLSSRSGSMHCGSHYCPPPSAFTFVYPEIFLFHFRGQTSGRQLERGTERLRPLFERAG